MHRNKGYGSRIKTALLISEHTIFLPYPGSTYKRLGRARFPLLSKRDRSQGLLGNLVIKGSPLFQEKKEKTIPEEGKVHLLFFSFISPRPGEKKKIKIRLDLFALQKGRLINLALQLQAMRPLI